MNKQIIIDKLKNEIACKENIIYHLAERNIKLQTQLESKEQECEAYKMEAEEGYEINVELKAKNEELKKCYKNNLALLEFEETNTIKLVNKVMKLEQTLAEIKEIVENEMTPNCDTYIILQKINEVENDN